METIKEVYTCSIAGKFGGNLNLVVGGLPLQLPKLNLPKISYSHIMCMAILYNTEPPNLSLPIVFAMAIWVQSPNLVLANTCQYFRCICAGLVFNK